MTSAFHFDSLVWDWPIAIYLFLLGISSGLVTLAVLLRRCVSPWCWGRARSSSVC